MANELLTKPVARIVFASTEDFPNSGVGPPTTNANDILFGSPTNGLFDLTSLAANGGARASSKVDLTELQSSKWQLNACLEHAPTPVDNETCAFYWASTPNSTTAEGNPGGLSGVDATFTDLPGILGQFQFIGALLLRANIINIGKVGLPFSPMWQYGMLVMVNHSAAAMHTVMDETHITLTEFIDELQ